jgi:prepilin-type N-terminal cleavage/methylation domain-containing protein
MRRSGFTTIEMVIVVAIIGIIALIGFPKIRRTLDKTNVRSARDALSTEAVIARSAAIQRGCRGVIHFTGGTTPRVWVTTQCGAKVDTVAGVEQLGTRFNVSLTATRDSVQYDPRGLSLDNAVTVVRITGAAGNTDSVMINTIGKVVRQ